MACITSSLGRGGPSPSELLRARTTCADHPSGVASSSRRSPSGVNAQLRDAAFASTTSRRSRGTSLTVDAQNVASQLQPVAHRVELERRPDQAQLERTIFP